MVDVTQTTDWRDFQGRYAKIIDDTTAFKKSLNEDFPVYLRPNLSRLSRDELVQYLNEHYPEHGTEIPFASLPMVKVSGPRKFWGGRLEHHIGLYFIQALSSLLPVLALELEGHEQVLDMCAAPGGKTTHMASLLNNGGCVYANEPSIGRCRVLKANIDRMALCNVTILTQWGEKLELPLESMDKILLDGPCSSEGTLRESIKNKRYVEYNKSFRVKLQMIQRQLLAKAYDLLKPGGTLVYSTCTYDPDENEKQVQWCLNEYSDLELVALPADFPEELSPGIDLPLTKRVYPHHINSIGFYVAKFIKR